MKDNSKKKAPRVGKYNMDRNFMNENPKGNTKKSPVGPLTKKRLSK